MATQRNPYNRDRYWRALGKFVDQFSEVEEATHILLWQRTKTSMKIGRAVFSGVRIKEGMNLIKRVGEVCLLPPGIAADQKYIFAQLNIITGLRNDILHYGALNLGSEIMLVTNLRSALTTERLRTKPVSSRILLDAARDLHKIKVHLIERHLWREPGLPSPFSLRDLRLLDAAWKYKPPQQARSHRKTRDTTPKR